MTNETFGQDGRVLAVLVLYRRRPDETAAWDALKDMLQQAGSFRLAHCLICDNSPERNWSEEALPDRMSVEWAPENPGTAGAYARAAAYAEAKGCAWLLLLDQDTALPRDYLAKVSRAAVQTPDASIFVPRVWHGEKLVSPAVITRNGNVRPTARPERQFGSPTAISSGMLVAASAVRAAQPFPAAIWLDYVDHWMFLSFAKRNLTISLLDVDLPHDLSILRPRALGDSRLISILRAENAFYQAFGQSARALRPVRQALRAAKFAMSGNFGLAGTTIRHVFSPRIRSS